MRTRLRLIVGALLLLVAPADQECLDEESRRFLDAHCPYPAAALAPCISNEFIRLTLLGERFNERLTIDWGLSVGDGRRTADLSDVAIVEVKQPRYSNAGPAARARRDLRVREGALSKYCVATVRLGASRTNPFRPAMRAMELLST